MQQPPRMFGMPPGGQSLPNQSMALNQAGQSKIDPNQIPRLAPSASVIVHETRQGNQANPPPVIIILALVKYIDCIFAQSWYSLSNLLIYWDILQSLQMFTDFGFYSFFSSLWSLQQVTILLKTLEIAAHATWGVLLIRFRHLLIIGCL